MSNSDSPITYHWTLDRRVNIATIFVFLTQLVAFVWMFSENNFQLAEHEKRISALEVKQEETRSLTKDVAEIKIHLQYLNKDLSEIGRFLKEGIEWVPPSKTKKPH